MIEKDELETFRAQITNERCQVENKIFPKTANRHLLKRHVGNTWVSFSTLLFREFFMIKLTSLPGLIDVS